MAASRPLKIALIATLTVTLGIKLASAHFEIPSSPSIVDAVGVFLGEQGFALDATTRIAGRATLVAERDNCVLRIVPIAAQGWHETSLRAALQPQETLTFVYKSNLRRDTQDRWLPLVSNYARLTLRHFGLPVGYDPVLAIAHVPACDPSAIEWGTLPAVPFTRAQLPAPD